MNKERIANIEARLRDALNPSYLQVKDQSHLHAGHAGAREGKGHFEVTISAGELNGLNRIATHRRVYEILSDLMESDIHALKINIRQS